jgi:hypothetical protein
LLIRINESTMVIKSLLTKHNAILTSRRAGSSRFGRSELVLSRRSPFLEFYNKKNSWKPGKLWKLNQHPTARPPSLTSGAASLPLVSGESILAAVPLTPHITPLLSLGPTCRVIYRLVMLKPSRPKPKERKDARQELGRRPTMLGQWA